MNGPGLYLIALWPGLAVLEKEQNTRDDMDREYQKQTFAEDGNDEGMTVEIVGVGLEQFH